jgi:hypothetical protein
MMDDVTLVALKARRRMLLADLTKEEDACMKRATIEYIHMLDDTIASRDTAISGPAAAAAAGDDDDARDPAAR